MRIPWRAAFEPPLARVPLVFSHGKAEPRNHTLETLEAETLSLIATASRELLGAASLGEQLERFEGRLRGLLLDPSLTPRQAARLERAQRHYHLLLPLGQVRQHTERAGRLVRESNGLVRFELARLSATVAWLGSKTAGVLTEPGGLQEEGFYSAQSAAAQELAFLEIHLQAELSPREWRITRAALLALGLASDTFTALHAEHTRLLLHVDSPLSTML